MKRFLTIILSIILVSTVFVTSGCTKKTDIVIYSCMEEFRTQALKEKLAEQFPNYNFDIQYFSAGVAASKIKSESGANCDIVLDLDYSYLEGITEYLEDLSGYDYSVYLDDIVPTEKKYLPAVIWGSAVIVNTDLLSEADYPTSYADLANPKYKNKIMMPNPKSSGTGYGFVNAIVNMYNNEDEAFEYFEALSSNIKQFTTSGSGPVNSLSRNEIEIGVGMIFQAVREINLGAKLKVLSFEEGNPYSVAGNTVMKGKLSNENVKAVFDYITNTWNMYDKVHFMPEPIFKNQEASQVENFPTNIKYADISGSTDTAKRDRLLSKWLWQ